MRSTFKRNIIQGVIITIITSVVGALLYGTWAIFVAVTFDIPKKLENQNKATEILRDNFINYQNENKEQHQAFVYRDDKTIDKLNETYNILLQNVIDIKQKLKMQINIQNILMKNISINKTDSIINLTLK